MKKNKKVKIKGCACYGVNSIHPCFCSPFSNKDKPKQLKEAGVIKSVCKHKHISGGYFGGDKYIVKCKDCDEITQQTDL